MRVSTEVDYCPRMPCLGAGVFCRQLVSGNKLIFDLDVIDVMEALSYKVVLMGACFILAFARATQARGQISEFVGISFDLNLIGLESVLSFSFSIPTGCRVARHNLGDRAKRTV